MGLYDEVICRNEFTRIQIKSTARQMNVYRIGDEISLPDGVHIGFEGVFVVADSKVFAVYDQLHDKWGGIIWPREVVELRNPVKQAIAKIENEHKNP
jgi:hypothetical protein